MPRNGRQCRETANPAVLAVGEPVLTLTSYMLCRCYMYLEPENAFVLVDNKSHSDPSSLEDDDNNMGSEGGQSIGGNGEVVVGYILGTPHTMAFFQKYTERFIPYLQSQGIQDPGTSDDRIEDASPAEQEEDSGEVKAMKTALYSIATLALPRPTDQLLAKEHNEFFRLYPGHLHINILPSHQRRGLGRNLISTFLDHIRGLQEQRGLSKGIQLVMAGDNTAGEKFYQGCGFGRFQRVLDGGKSGEVGRDDWRIGEVSGHVWLCKEL